ncbi:MAG: ribonuclease III [Candidatus Cloacimonetes bacterium]|nr:ribonuclease III [Candidatus Cloacimonadota bacterium]
MNSILSNIIKSTKNLKHDSRLAKIQKVIKYKFKRKAFLEAALLHTSHPDSSDSNIFERMEFLGDAVLGLVIAEKVFSDNPGSSEGNLSILKAKIVSKKYLSLKAKELGLADYLYLSSEAISTGGRESISILSDAMEALICAVYLDGGYAAARIFIRQHILRDYHDEIFKNNLRDYKSRLQEYTQAHFQELPVYKIIKEEGPDHDKTFSVEVYVQDKMIGSGKGHNKKEAHQNAAREACLYFSL